ncbi:ArnT family glycosyltransferase [Patescibacteria group bacterium]
MPAKVKSILLNNKLLVVVFLISFMLRFWGLGYSDFYGDETKTFYLDKTVPASEFFLNQRKGPMQFFIVWGVEKVIGGHHEFWTRLPFFLAGSAAVVVFYYVVKELFSEKVALVSTLLFGLNGFFIAFSKTIQYQSFLLLFGLQAVFFGIRYLKMKSKKAPFYAAASGVFIALAYLSHWDAIFFDLVLTYILIQKYLKNRKSLREMVIYFALPAFIIVGIFYIPYIFGGYLETHVQDYLARRLIGSNFAHNLSWYTFWIYNPNVLWLFVSAFVLPYFFKKTQWQGHLVMIWFLSAFIAFEFWFSNPGTHILNYVLPLTILAGMGIVSIYEWIQKRVFKNAYGICILFLLFSIFMVDIIVFGSDGYPWKSNKVDKKYHLFLYGFNYNRGWRQIRDYFNKLDGVRGIWTNDNDTIAEYYLREVDYTPPGSNFMPQYYVHVYNNQEFLPNNTQKFYDEFLVKYELQEAFYVRDKMQSAVFKLAEIEEDSSL